MNNISKKKVQLGLFWKEKWINFCAVCFTTKSFIFSSNFHRNLNKLTIGNAVTTKEGYKLIQGVESQKINQNGYHITLHQPTLEQRGVLHLRENSRGDILDARRLDWFPVIKPFRLLTLYSPPLVNCELSPKSSDFFSPIVDSYENSIEVTVDIFPRNIVEHYPSSQSLWIFWGYCPEYLVRVSFNLLNQKTEAVLLWPTGLFNSR